MLRALIHHWRLNLAVTAGAAVATAVLTGALVVGDSVRGSLRSLTEERLGEIDLAVVAEGLFRADLAERLSASPGGGASAGPNAESSAGPSGGSSGEVDEIVAAPAIALQGTAENPGSGARAARVAVWGVDERFGGLFATELPLGRAERAPGQIFPSVVINGALARELGVEAGDDVILSFERLSEVPRETLLGRTDPGSVLDSLRLTVRTALPDDPVDEEATATGLARFGLTPHQTLPLNAFVSLSRLQEELGRPGEANLLLVDTDDGPGGLAARLEATASLEDLGVKVGIPGASETSETPTGGFVVVESREYVLRSPVVRAVERIAEELGAETQPVLTYLANSMTKTAANRESPKAEAVGSEATGEPPTMPYSTVTAVPLPPDPAFPALRPLRPPSSLELESDELLLNAWAAEDLEAAAGDLVEMTFYGVGADDRLTTESATFRVAGVVAMEGLAADRSLTPDFPGIADAEDISSWDPPFPVDLSKIRPRDELYWDEHRGTPKAFVPLETGQRLWGNRFGRLTAIRLAPPEGLSPEELRARLAERLPRALDPRSLGLAVQPVRQRGLDAAAGATDFSQLFLAFSFFLIVAAALLVGLLFSLAIESRASEVGVLLAVGYRRLQVSRRLMAESLVLALVGVLAGSGLAVAYGAAVLAALGSWWVPLLGEEGSGLLTVHVGLTSLALGFCASVALVLAATWWATRRLTRLPVTRLLAGTASERREALHRGGRAKGVAWASAGVALSLLLTTALTGVSSPVLFFGAGAALLTAGLAAVFFWLRRDPGGLDRLAETSGAVTLAGAAARNSARNPGRSLLSVALVACAAFVLVGVGAFRKSGVEDLGRHSGAGGFELVAEASVPLRGDLAEADDRAELGLSEETAALLEGEEVFPLRLRPGEDASCLNLYKPEKPRLVGVTPALVGRGGFHFRDAVEERENPWSLLEGPLDGAEDGVVPAIGDYASVRWILQLGLGDELEITDERGEPLRLRIVARLEGSIFQSELLIPESAFLEHFPSRGGFGYFLIGSGRSHLDPQELAASLESDLERFGFDATSTRERLAAFEAVENTYLTTFQALGGLGLLLGTLGLGVVLIKNVLERRAELATLRAFGFRRGILAALVVVENAFLLLVGLGVGAVAGLAAVAPHLAAGGGEVPWGALGATLLAVFVVGLLASLTAVAATLRVPLLPVLKSE